VRKAPQRERYLAATLSGSAADVRCWVGCWGLDTSRSPRCRAGRASDASQPCWQALHSTRARQVLELARGGAMRMGGRKRSEPRSPGLAPLIPQPRRLWRLLTGVWVRRVATRVADSRGLESLSSVLTAVRHGWLVLLSTGLSCEFTAQRRAYILVQRRHQAMSLLMMTACHCSS
jgi:hypothetical protein